ncbi:hypothetical protein B0H10DRAFT_1954976 [Mycena sp. CBHHK59/15]|nr:hypothetical protein B0H10DRAFT_1954976 [Mycena sp. CBHHK59/15]
MAIVPELDVCGKHHICILYESVYKLRGSGLRELHAQSGLVGYRVDPLLASSRQTLEAQYPRNLSLPWYHWLGPGFARPLSIITYVSIEQAESIAAAESYVIDHNEGAGDSLYDHWVQNYLESAYFEQWSSSPSSVPPQVGLVHFPHRTYQKWKLPSDASAAPYRLVCAAQQIHLI